MTDVDLNDVVGDMLKMLRRVIGEHVELRFVKGRDLGVVRADAGQVGRAIAAPVAQKSNYFRFKISHYITLY